MTLDGTAADGVWHQRRELTRCKDKGCDSSGETKHAVFGCLTGKPHAVLGVFLKMKRKPPAIVSALISAMKNEHDDDDSYQLQQQ